MDHEELACPTRPSLGARTILETAKLAGIDPKAYLRRVVHAARRGEPVRLPHQIAAAAAA